MDRTDIVEIKQDRDQAMTMICSTTQPHEHYHNPDTENFFLVLENFIFFVCNRLGLLLRTEYSGRSFIIVLNLIFLSFRKEIILRFPHQLCLRLRSERKKEKKKETEREREREREADGERERER